MKKWAIIGNNNIKHIARILFRDEFNHFECLTPIILTKSMYFMTKNIILRSISEFFKVSLGICLVAASNIAINVYSTSCEKHLE